MARTPGHAPFSAADQMMQINLAVQSSLLARVEEQKRLAELRKLGATLDVNSKTTVRYAMVEAQRVRRGARQEAIEAAKPKEEKKQGPVLAMKVSDILAEAKALLAKQSQDGRPDSRGSADVTGRGRRRSAFGLDQQDAPPGRSGSNLGPVGSPLRKTSQDAVQITVPAATRTVEQAAADTKLALGKLVAHHVERNASKRTMLHAPTKPQGERQRSSAIPSPRAPRAELVQVPGHINESEEPRRADMASRAEAKLRVIANSEFMHRYADRIEFHPDKCVDMGCIFDAAAGTVPGRSAGGGRSSSPSPHKITPMDIKANALYFPELRRYLHHLMGITAGRMVFNLPAKAFESRWFTPLVSEMVILAFWHVQVRFIEERERQKVNKKKEKAKRLALKGSAAEAAGESRSPMLKSPSMLSRQGTMRGLLNLEGEGAAAAGSAPPAAAGEGGAAPSGWAKPTGPPEAVEEEEESEAPDVSLTVQEEAEAELAAAMSPTREGLASLTLIGHSMALAYTTLLKQNMAERMAEDEADGKDEGEEEEEEEDAFQSPRWDALGNEIPPTPPGSEVQYKRAKRSMTRAEQKAVAESKARVTRAFLDVLPWAIADTVWQAYWQLLAGSRATYGASFRLQLFVEIGRLLTGVELAPISILAFIGKHFPRDPLAVLHREFAEGAEAEAATLAGHTQKQKASGSTKRSKASRTPAQVSSLLDGPASGTHASSRNVATLDHSAAEAGGAHGEAEEHAKEEVDYVMTDIRVAHLAHTLGFRTPFDLFKSTKKADRLLLGLGEASRVEILRKMHRTLALPVSAYLVSGAAVPPPLLQASASVGALLDLPPANHPSLAALLGGRVTVSLSTTGDSLLGRTTATTATAINDSDALQDAPTLANPSLNRFLIHMETWAEEALKEDSGFLQDEEAQARRKAIMAAAHAAAEKRQHHHKQAPLAPAHRPEPVQHVVVVQQAEVEAPAPPPPPPPSPLRGLRRSIGKLASDKTDGKTDDGLSGKFAMMRMRSQRSLLDLQASEEVVTTQLARMIAQNMHRLKKAETLVKSKGVQSSPHKTAKATLLSVGDSSRNLLAMSGGGGRDALDSLQSVDVDEDESVDDEDEDDEDKDEDDNDDKEEEEEGVKAHKAEGKDGAPAPLVKTDSIPNRLGKELVKQSSLRRGGLLGATGTDRGPLSSPNRSLARGQLTLQGDAAGASMGESRTLLPALSPLRIAGTLHSTGALAGTVTDSRGLASITATVPGSNLGVADTDLATKILSVRAKRRLLEVPFVYTTTSTLLSRVLPDVKATERGQRAMHRTVPVFWANIGGVDTAHAYSKQSASDLIEDIHATNARIQMEARSAAVTSHRAELSAKAGAESARGSLLKGSAQTLAREAARVRQERIKATKERAAAAQRGREERRLYTASFGSHGDPEASGADPSAPQPSPAKGNKDDVRALINKADPGYAGAVAIPNDPIAITVSLPGVSKSTLPPVALNFVQLAALASQTLGVSGHEGFTVSAVRMAADMEGEKSERRAYAVILAKQTTEAAVAEEEAKRRKAVGR